MTRAELVLDLDALARGTLFWQGPSGSAIAALPVVGKHVTVPLAAAGTYTLLLDTQRHLAVAASYAHDGTPGRHHLSLALEDALDLELQIEVDTGLLLDDVEVALAPEAASELSPDDRSRYLGILARSRGGLPEPTITQWTAVLPAGSTGACVLHNVPASLAQLPIRVTSAHGRYQPALALVAAPAASITLASAWEYQITAQDPGGQPLKDLEVALVDRLLETRLQTSAAFTNAQVAPGRYLAVIGCAGHVFATHEVEVTSAVGPGLTLIPVVLAPAAVIAGQVQHQSTAVADALVHATDATTPIAPAVFVGTSNSDGSFAVAVPAGSGPYRIDVIAARFEPYTAATVMPGDFLAVELALAEAKSVAHAEHVVHVNWQSSASLSPAPENTEIYAIGPSQGIFAAGRGGERDGNAGTIDLTLDPASYTLVAFDGTACGFASADLGGGDTTAAVVLSSPAATAMVAVVRDGQPAAQVPIEITDPSLGYVLASGVTGADGTFSAPLFPGSFVARARAENGYVHAQPLDVTPQGGLAHITLPSPGYLGKARMELVDPTGARAHLVKTVQLIDQDGGSFSLRALTDPTGVAAIADLPPGNYRATAFDLEIGGTASFELLAAFAAGRSATVVVSPGSTTTCTLTCSGVQDGVQYGDKYQHAIDEATNHPPSTGGEPRTCDCWVYFYHLRHWMTKNASASDKDHSSALALGWWDTLFLDTWAFGTFDGGATASAMLEGWCYDMYVYEQRCWKCGTSPPEDQEYYRVADIELKIRGVVAQIDSSASAAAQTAVSAATDAEPEFKTVRATGGQAVGGWTSQQASLGVQIGVSADGPEAGAGLSLNVELNPLPSIEYKEIDKLIAQGIPGPEGSRMKGHALTLVKETSGEAQSISSQLGLIGRVDKAFAAIATSMKYAIRTVCECKVAGCPMEKWVTIDRKSFGADHIARVEGSIAVVKALDFKR